MGRRGKSLRLVGLQQGRKTLTGKEAALPPTPSTRRYQQLLGEGDGDNGGKPNEVLTE